MSDLQGLAAFGAALALLSGLWAASWVWRKQRYSTLGLLFLTAGPMLALVAYLSLVDLRLKDAAMVGLIGGGFVMGVLAGPLAALSRRAPLPGKRRGTIGLSFAAWLPLPGALAVAALQISAAIGSPAGLILSLALLEAAAGFGAGAFVTIFLRRVVLKRPEAVVAPAQAAAAETGAAGK